MKNIILLSTFVLVLSCLISCSKDKPDTTTNAPTIYGSYSFEGLSHNVRRAARFNEALSVADYSGAIVPVSNTTVLFYFASFPTQSGTYQLVPGGSAPTSPGQMAIVFSSSSYSSYYQGAPTISGTAAVTVDSLGKVGIVVADSVPLVSQDNPADIGLFTANVRQ